jgi:hypothetical protein
MYRIQQTQLGFLKTSAGSLRFQVKVTASPGRAVTHFRCDKLDELQDSKSGRQSVVEISTSCLRQLQPETDPTKRQNHCAF